MLRTWKRVEASLKADNVAVAFVCRSGKHRSVAMAKEFKKHYCDKFPELSVLGPLVEGIEGLGFIGFRV